MRDFPQELVDLVIDKLAESLYRPRESISDYSTVSRQWVDQTQKHHFRLIEFDDQDDLQRWCTVIDADPSGVSRHVRKLSWTNIRTLEGFDGHIRAFTGVREVELCSCDILISCFDVDTLALMGSSLVGLGILEGRTTPSLMSSLLAALPHLRRLTVHDLDVKRRRELLALPRIPFFEGADAFSLFMTGRLPGELNWIPPTARIRHLETDPLCISRNVALVNRWLASSGESLEFFAIGEDPRGTPFDRLDLSGCTSLKCLRLPVPFDQPGRYADVILPSVSSSRLLAVVLELSGADSTEQMDLGAWGRMDRHLCRLAKGFKAANGGRTMRVEAIMPWWHDMSILERLRYEWPMTDLEREASVLIMEGKIKVELLAMPDDEPMSDSE